MKDMTKRAIIIGGVTLIIGTSVPQQTYALDNTNSDVQIIIRPGEYPNKPGKRNENINEDFDINCPIRYDEETGWHIQEYDLNYKVANAIVEYLKSQGVNVILLETENKSQDLNAAGRRAKQYNAPIYLSIHNNSYRSTDEGYFAIVNPNDKISTDFAIDVTNALTSNPMMIPKRENRINTGYIGEMSEKPGNKINCLLEMSFALSNPNEAKKVVNEKQLDFYAKTIGNELIQVLKEERYYTSPNEPDIDREKKVIKLLEERFSEYQQKGYIPSMKIEGGYNTDQPIRERGWTYWHQLFNPRQLLIQGLLYESIMNIAKSKEEYAIGLLSINKCTDFNSKLAVWDSGASNVKNTFFNQALNTLFNYGTRGLIKLSNIWKDNINSCNFTTHINTIVAIDARDLNTKCDLWITDPPYADAVNYHELSEFFLAWDKKILEKEFKEWYTDSKRVLAIKGKGQSFNESMIEVYSNLAKNMPDNGMQVIMFAHSDIKIWNDLIDVLKKSNLQIIKKIDIRTETESGGLQKEQNRQRYTSLLICKKINN